MRSFPTLKLVLDFSLIGAISAAGAGTKVETGPASLVTRVDQSDFTLRLGVDEYNRQLTDTDRAATPVSGGQIVVRLPRQPENLSPLLARFWNEMWIVGLISDPLVEFSYSTMEDTPALASSWCWSDTIQRKGGSIEHGRIVSLDDEVVVFVPGASTWTFSNQEVDVDEDSATITPKATGRKHSGRIKIMPTTVEVDEGEGPAASAVRIPISELAGLPTDPFSTSARPYIVRRGKWQFVLRKDVAWHDGESFGADDVIFSVEALKALSDTSPHLKVYSSIASVDESTEHTGVVITLDREIRDALDVLGALPLIPKHSYPNITSAPASPDFAVQLTEATKRTLPIGTGPYTAVASDAGGVLLARNKTYWRARGGRPCLDTIRFITISDQAKAVDALLAGMVDLDTSFDADPAQIKRLKSASGVVMGMVPGIYITYVRMNQRHPALRDRSVRQAIALLVPYEKLWPDTGLEFAARLTGPFPQMHPASDPSIRPLTTSPDTARQILEKAGWQDLDGDGVREREVEGRTVKLIFTYLHHTARDYQAPQAQSLREALSQGGIQLNVRGVSWEVFQKDVKAGNFDITRSSQALAFNGNPAQIFYEGQPSPGEAASLFHNDELEDLLTKAERSESRLERWRVLREAHRLAYEEQPVVFLYTLNFTLPLNSRLRGVKLYPEVVPVHLEEIWCAP